MAEVRTIISTSQAEARQIAEQLRQARNQIAGACGRTIDNGDEGIQVQQGTIQRIEALADAQYRAAMAEAGEEVPEGTVITLPRFTAIKAVAARLMELIELAEADYTDRQVQVPVMVSTPEATA